MEVSEIILSFFWNSQRKRKAYDFLAELTSTTVSKQGGKCKRKRKKKAEEDF